MRRMMVAVGLAALALVTGVMSRPGVSAQPTGCSGDVPAAQAERRRLAIELMRAINTAQATWMTRLGRYGTPEEVSPAQVPPSDIVTSIVTAGDRYSVLIRDTTDPCGRTLFSDQRGVIFVGTPLQ